MNKQQNASDGEGGPVRCQNTDCKNEIGRLYPLADGLYLLDLGGGILLDHAHGPCKMCGRHYYFDINEQKLTRLIKSIKERS